MSIFTNLAKLQTMMPFEALLEAVGAECQPSAGGWISVGHQFLARIDFQGLLGRVEFDYRFPATIPIFGFHIGMTLDEVLASGLGFRMLPRKLPSTNSSYVARTLRGDDILVQIDRTGLVRQIEFERPGLQYAEGNRYKATSIEVSASDYADTSEMLWEWAARQTFESDYLSYLGYAKWLSEEATPDDWHLAVPEVNWGFGLGPLHWIIRQPDCDKATALTAFYLTRPGQFLDDHVDRTRVAAHDLDSFDLVDEIRRRFLDGFYTRSEFSFDGENAVRNEAYLPDKFDEEQFDCAIPKAMRLTIQGREAKGGKSDGWDRGTPDTRRPSKLIPPPISIEEKQA
ncbi:DUF4274 domain-containing protein [Paraburkholderia sp. BCC1876]|uniref:DUF4274 domain-containing protein n=1 Tax=Paraburkholderia sp. BCC1876 TaxID=2676303 RepID=UPI0015912553|nr:DUF4274 domain-containing protein [Paraburkholderia sp. BCC1876]